MSGVDNKYLSRNFSVFIVSLFRCKIGIILAMQNFIFVMGVYLCFCYVKPIVEMLLMGMLYFTCNEVAFFSPFIYDRSCRSWPTFHSWCNQSNG